MYFIGYFKFWFWAAFVMQSWHGHWMLEQETSYLNARKSQMTFNIFLFLWILVQFHSHCCPAQCDTYSLLKRDHFYTAVL